jgi:hypothetical protein
MFLENFLNGVIKMKDDKFKKLSDNEIGKISGGVSHETEGLMGMKAFDNFDENGNFESTTIRPKKDHLVIDNETYDQARKDGIIENINEKKDINRVLDTIK